MSSPVSQRDVHGARWVEHFIVAENDMVMQSGSREHDWPGGRSRGFDAPAGTYVRDTAAACRLAAGRIAERRTIRHDLAVLLQLVAIRPPG